MATALRRPVPAPSRRDIGGALHARRAGPVRPHGGNERRLVAPVVPRRDRLLADARQRLGDADYEAALTTGREWSFGQAVTEPIAALTASTSQRPGTELALASRV